MVKRLARKGQRIKAAGDGLPRKRAGNDGGGKVELTAETAKEHKKEIERKFAEMVDPENADLPERVGLAHKEDFDNFDKDLYRLTYTERGNKIYWYATRKAISRKHKGHARVMDAALNPDMTLRHMYNRVHKQFDRIVTDITLSDSDRRNEERNVVELLLKLGKEIESKRAEKKKDNYDKASITHATFVIKSEADEE